MSFATPAFLWYFMPVVLGLYWVLPRTWRNGLIALASLFFYAWGGGVFVLLLLLLMAANFAAGIAIDNLFDRGLLGRRRVWLVATVGLDLSALGIWKYAGFATHQLAHISHAIGGPVVPVAHLALPIGISFFTFHHISYVVDVYRRDRPAQRHPLRFVTYIAMFPQLIAGPIVRYHEIAEQLGEVRRRRMDDFVEGFPRFALGLAKKVVVADTVAPIANAVFDARVSALDTRTAWIGALAYTVQIYFDFSGYSDMAIGLGRMFGFRLPENFARPYSAVSITDFWRRWHMSLSRWFRDYCYIPLGGNRRGTALTYRNLYVVFALTGLWHGASWTFVVWGLYHGTLLVVERVTGFGRVAEDVSWPAARRALTLLLTVIGWVLFRAPDIGHTAGMLHLMFVPHLVSTSTVLASASTRAELTLGLALLVVLLPREFVMGRFLEQPDRPLVRLGRLGYSVVAAPVAAILVAAGTFSPFLYFRF